MCLEGRNTAAGNKGIKIAVYTEPQDRLAEHGTDLGRSLCYVHFLAVVCTCATTSVRSVGGGEEKKLLA